MGDLVFAQPAFGRWERGRISLDVLRTGKELSGRCRDNWRLVPGRGFRGRGLGPRSLPDSQTGDSRRPAGDPPRLALRVAGVPLRPVPAPGDLPQTAPPGRAPAPAKTSAPATVSPPGKKRTRPPGSPDQNRPRSDSRDFGSREIRDGSRSGPPAFPTAVAAPEHAGLRPPHRSARCFRIAENRSPPQSAFDSPGRKARQPLTRVGRTLHRPRRAFGRAPVAAGRLATGQPVSLNAPPPWTGEEGRSR